MGGEERCRKAKRPGKNERRREGREGMKGRQDKTASFCLSVNVLREGREKEGVSGDGS
jgi:hypothetical protein